jgi:hypothetical protein
MLAENTEGMVDYSELTRDELYKLIEVKHRGVLLFLYNKYAPAIYGVILRQVDNRHDADDILCKTFVMCFRTRPNHRHVLPGIYIRLHNIATGIINKTSILYPIRSGNNNQNWQHYS